MAKYVVGVFIAAPVSYLLGTPAHVAITVLGSQLSLLLIIYLWDWKK